MATSGHARIVPSLLRHVKTRYYSVVLVANRNASLPMVYFRQDAAQRDKTEEVRDMGREKRYTVEEIAQELGVHPDTVRRWIRRGELDAIDLGGSAGYRISQEALNRFLKERGSRSKED